MSIMVKGIIALDIDGTLVTQHRPLSPDLALFLQEVNAKGWVILFATGRTIRWSMEHLSQLPFPFYLAPYNGACLFSFPQKEIILSALMDHDDLMLLAPFINEFGAVIYEGGGEERIFYTARRFSELIFAHLRNRQELQKEEWIAINGVGSLPRIHVAGVRFFLSPTAALMLGETINASTSLLAPTMKDSFNADLRIVQVTAQGASKGQALKALRKTFPRALAIAAGDDMNDIDLLEEANIGIAMASAPEELKKISTFIASTTGHDPIIDALKKSIQRAEHEEA
jgi:5-amino-6-(5-phospho-D-ribitylamino)uracil phosphatase